MDKISINDLPRIKKELVGYKLTFNSNGVVKFNKKAISLSFLLNFTTPLELKVSL